MMQASPSRPIFSNQAGIHEKLPEILRRHQRHIFRKPAARHTVAAFEQAARAVVTSGRPVVLDSGCGSGESTQHLARRFPGHLVIGFDKSLARLQKNPFFETQRKRNLLLLRADAIDFWMLLAQANWPIERHYVLYPNPWPKRRQLKRRFHGHPVFFDLIRLSPYLELRSNWEIYLLEFAEAVYFATGRRFPVQRFEPAPAITPFERKYHASGHPLFKLSINFGSVEL